MPPPKATHPEEVFWATALALLRHRATVVYSQANEERQPRDYSRWGAPGGQTETILDLRVRLAGPPSATDAPRLELEVATLLAERVGMRLAREPPPVASVAAVPAPQGTGTREESLRTLMLTSIGPPASGGASAPGPIPTEGPPSEPRGRPRPVAADVDLDDAAARFMMMELD